MYSAVTKMKPSFSATFCAQRSATSFFGGCPERGCWLVEERHRIVAKLQKLDVHVASCGRDVPYPGSGLVAEAPLTRGADDDRDLWLVHNRPANDEHLVCDATGTATKETGGSCDPSSFFRLSETCDDAMCLFPAEGRLYPGLAMKPFARSSVFPELAVILNPVAASHLRGVKFVATNAHRRGGVRSREGQASLERSFTSGPDAHPVSAQPSRLARDAWPFLAI